jgi:hypothetical protein
MSNTQAERAVTQLYESDSIRSELRDEEASLLLSWGESRLSELAGRNLPDSQFEQLSENLRALLSAINVCVGKRKTSPSQHLSMMATISSAAEAAGYRLLPDAQTGFLKHQAALANQDAISELLGLLKPAEAAQPPSQTIGEAVAELVPSEAVPAVHDAVGALRTSPPNPLSVYSEGEQKAEISDDQPDTPTVSGAENIAPAPEELPEMPPLPPQSTEEG